MLKLAKKLNTEDRVCAALLSGLLAVYLGFIWTESIGLRNGDYAARLMIAQNIQLDARFFFHDIWQHLWPPLPHIFNRLAVVMLTTFGLNTGDSIKALLSISAVLGIVSLWLTYLLGKSFEIPFGGILGVLMVTTMPIVHVINMSVLSQVVSMPLMLAGLLLFIREVDRGESFYQSGFLFLAASFCRSDTVMFSGMLSFLFLARKEWKTFLTFNLTSSAFFLIHQAILIATSRVNYFDLSKYYDWNLTTGQKKEYILRQFSEMWQVPTGAVIVAILVAFTLAFLVSHGLIVRHEALKQRRSRYVFIAWSGVLVFMLVFPFLTENGKGNHARDFLFSLQVLSIACGIGLSILVERYGIRQRGLKLGFQLTLVALLCVLSMRAVLESANLRPPSEATFETRAWLEDHLEPGDAVLYEVRWEHYFSAYTHEPDTRDMQWTVGYTCYRLEIGEDEALNDPRVDELRFYDVVVNSALHFVASRKPRYIVTYPIEHPDRIEDSKNRSVKHRIRPHYILSKMEVLTSGRRLLQVPGIIDESMIFEKVFASPECHIWEYRPPANESVLLHPQE